MGRAIRADRETGCAPSRARRCRSAPPNRAHPAIARQENPRQASSAAGTKTRFRTLPSSAGLLPPPLVSPPVALPIDVSARILTEVGRTDDEGLEALWPGLVTTPRAGWDAHRIP